MDSNIRTVVKTLSYRTAVAASIFLAALAMNYSAGFGLTFVVLSYTVGFVSFWIQEKLWNMVKWQRVDNNDTRIRSVAKTVTWRLWSMFVLFVIGLILGLSSAHALEWTIVTNILFVVVHYTHERIWNLIKWGKLL
jgi:uncharacterized membrane protein|tara:strand:- start:15686 stop:16093 length:408 start_codon:yes stop_codon:yes gene_type:complete